MNVYHVCLFKFYNKIKAVTALVVSNMCVRTVSVVTCSQLTVPEAHTDVVQSHRATVPEAPAGADKNQLKRKQ